MHDAIMLRGICANYFERQVEPILRDLQQSQKKLASEVEALAGRSGEQPHGVNGELNGCSASALSVEELCVEVQNKASTFEVAEQFATLQTTLESSVMKDEFQKLLADMERQFAELRATMGEKRPADDTPTMCQFKDLAAKVDTKSDRKNAATASQLNDLSSKVDSLSRSQDAPSQEQFRKLSQTVEKLGKSSSKTPTMIQFTELAAAVERKVDASLCPTLAHVDELAAAVKSSPGVGQLKKLQGELERKANTADVATAAQCEVLATQLASKANTAEVPTAERFASLAETMEKKIAFLASKWNSHQNAQPMAWYMPANSDTTSWTSQHPENAPGTWTQAQQDVQWAPTTQYFAPTSANLFPDAAGVQTVPQDGKSPIVC